MRYKLLVPSLFFLLFCFTPLKSYASTPSILHVYHSDYMTRWEIVTDAPLHVCDPGFAGAAILIDSNPQDPIALDTGGFGVDDGGCYTIGNTLYLTFSQGASDYNPGASYKFPETGHYYEIDSLCTEDISTDPNCLNTINTPSYQFTGISTLPEDNPTPTPAPTNTPSPTPTSRPTPVPFSESVLGIDNIKPTDSQKIGAVSSGAASTFLSLFEANWPDIVVMGIFFLAFYYWWDVIKRFIKDRTGQYMDFDDQGFADYKNKWDNPDILHNVLKEKGWDKDEYIENWGDYNWKVQETIDANTMSKADYEHKYGEGSFPVGNVTGCKSNSWNLDDKLGFHTRPSSNRNKYRP